MTGRAGEVWSDRPESARRLLHAAIEVIGEHGFHGTSTRAVAARAGLSPAAMYMHFPTKEDLLYQISLAGHELTLDLVEEASAASHDPVERVHAIVTGLVRWHAEHSTIARIIQYEHASLAPGHRREMIELRRRVEDVLRRAVDDGVRTGRFDSAAVPTGVLAIMSLTIDVARWYPVQTRRKPEQIARAYADLALRILNWNGGPEVMEPGPG
ncbi:TetR/AcrR family transcriptional regulator [Actinomadura rugatobispora]|uniref:TetR/AcrR family transcriptional regulator n=1 Tax=Actinomadura rugatobispora TaxID=1994 RepID=A0ABW0ZRC6_9ACTN|nr:TetR/AcrR family transcriptional regulator [Actinomadura rugatobispora]